MNKPMERRRNFYIKKKFQRNFIIKFCGLVTIGSIISGGIIYLMSESTVTTTFVNSKLTIKSTADFILPAVLLSSAVVVLLTGLAAIFITLFTSHKIAGPLYRIEKDITAVASGNLKMVFSLRHGDEIKPLVTSLNIMVGSIKAHIVDAQNTIEQIEGKQVPPEVKEKIIHLKETLDWFNT